MKVQKTITLNMWLYHAYMLSMFAGGVIACLIYEAGKSASIPMADHRCHLEEKLDSLRSESWRHSYEGIKWYMEREDDRK